MALLCLGRHKSPDRKRTPTAHRALRDALKSLISGIVGRFETIPTVTLHAGKRKVSMARLIYSAITSLDGYIADENGNFDWAAPDEEVHAFVNDLERQIGTHLYGRRMYNVMAAWETMDIGDEPPVIQDYAQIWRAADKIVYSRTLETATSAQTRIVRDFDPAAVRQMKANAERDISIGGPEIAAQALKSGLVDEIHLFLTPITIGGGTQALPNHVRLKLELLDERRFSSGVIHLHYRTIP